MKEAPVKIIFVYNANSGVGYKAFDFLHKIISPSTYQCSLCAITYGNFQMKNEWKRFIRKLPYAVEFWYKNDFTKEFSQEDPFPCVYLCSGSRRQLLLNAEEMEDIGLEEMKRMLKTRLAES